MQAKVNNEYSIANRKNSRCESENAEAGKKIELFSRCRSRQKIQYEPEAGRIQKMQSFEPENEF